MKKLQNRIRRKPAELWTIVKRIRSVGPDSTNDNTRYTQEQINNLAETLFPQIERNISQETANTYKPSIITQQELHTAKEMVRKKKYKGPDDITFKAFNRALELIPDIIFDIARMSFYTSHVPEHCQLTQGTIIPKKQAGKYRIVHVSTALTAFLEVIALNRFQHALEIHQIELVNRIITSVATHRGYLHNELTGSNAMRNNQTTLVALDISGAFDNVTQKEIIDKLIEKMPQEGVTYWIKEFILHRKITIKHKGMTSYYRQVMRGVPQGSALGPLLWNLAIEDIDRQIYGHCNEFKNTEILAYADDLTVISHGYQQQITQGVLDKINTYMKNKNLDINAQKSEMMVIRGPGRKPKQEDIPTLHLGQEPLTRKDKLTILGVPVTNKLTLDTRNETLQMKLRETKRFFRQLHLYKITDNMKEWRILIEASLRSILVHLASPVLAIDQRGRQWSNRQFFHSLAYIFGWPKNISQNMIYRVVHRV